MSRIFALLAFFVSSTVFAQASVRDASEAQAITALTERASHLAREDRFAGQLLVARRGKMLRDQSWGVADRDTGAAVSADTRFRIGSMNKMFTTIATLQLVEAGKINFSDTLAKYLPDSAPACRGKTGRNRDCAPARRRPRLGVSRSSAL